MSTTELDAYVQTCLHDYGISPWRRAKMAAKAIESYVRAEAGYDGPLPIPLEWEHRVPNDTEVTVSQMVVLTERDAGTVKQIAEAELRHLSLDPKPNAFGGVVELIETEAAEVEHEMELAKEAEHDAIAAELMKEAFDAEFTGDEDLAQKRFEKFWNRFRD